MADTSATVSLMDMPSRLNVGIYSEVSSYGCRASPVIRYSSITAISIAQSCVN